MTWPDGTYVAVGFYAKGKVKAQVQVQHEKLPDASAARTMREYWAAQLAVLEQIL